MNVSGTPGLSVESFMQQVELLDLADDRYELADPITVTVEVFGDRVIVSDDHVDMYGVGPTLNAALTDYRSSLIAYYEWLDAHERTRAAKLQLHFL